MSFPRWAPAVTALLLAGGAAAGAEPPRSAAVASIITARGAWSVQVEVARTSEEREHGLMERPALGPDEGMIFLYTAPRSGDAGFWMYHTLIPLDIAFIDGAGRIVSLQTMQPCTSDPARCPVYTPGSGYQSALEVNAGYFARHGVHVGDQVKLSGVAP